MSPKEGAEEADPSARACAWADRLADLGRVEQARRVLRTALDDHGGQISLALQLARLDITAGASASAIELLRKILGEHPGDLDCIRLLGETLLADGQVDEAAKVIGTVPVTDAALRQLAGEIWQAQGRHAEAVAAFGPPSSLSRRGRQLRRRSWWRGGGPFGMTRGERRPTGAACEPEGDIPAPDPPDVVLETAAWAEWLSKQGRPDEARRVLSEAFKIHGRHPALVRCAAQIEEDHDAGHTALYLWREASQATPGDIDVVVHLSRLLSSTSATPALIQRTADALRVLDGFPDQRHPRIRTARAYAIGAVDAGPSRIVAAYGGRDGLSPDDARRRRRLLWRSGGPLGQLRVMFSNQFRGNPYRNSGLRTEAESEDIARVLDSIHGEPAPIARHRIEEAWERHGRTPSLLLAYAQVDDDDNADWHSLALAAEAVRGGPDSLDAACQLALAIRRVFGYEAAAQLMLGLPEVMRQTPECRVLLGNFHRDAGNYASAVAAYGDSRDMDSYDRGSRRSCAWKAPLRRRRPSQRDAYDTVDLSAFDPVPAEVANFLDESARLEDEPTRARALLTAALERHGRNPWLLLELGRLERGDGDRHARAALAKEAIGATPEDPLITASGIRELWSSDYDIEALRLIVDIPKQMESSAVFRVTAGDVLRSWVFSANAVIAYADLDLSAWRRRRRRASWWRSGGPFGKIRSQLIRQEDTLMSSLGMSPLQVTALSELPLTASVAAAVRGDMGAYGLDLKQRTVLKPEIIFAWVDGLGLPVYAVLMLGAFMLAEYLNRPSAGLMGNLVASTAATAGAVSLLWILDKLDWRQSSYWLIWVISGAGAGFLLRNAGQWQQYAAGLTLAGVAGTGVTLTAAGAVMRVASSLRLARWQRKQAETAILSALLDMIGELGTALVRRDATVRRDWMAGLERLAVRVERDLPYALRSDDAESQRAIAARIQSAASTLRDMKRTVALPDDASWQDMMSQLNGLATALARGSFEDWPPPLPAPAIAQVKRPLWWRGMQVGRTVLVIIGPPLVAFLVPLVAPVTGPGLAWLRSATLVWALLAAVIALDPALGDRIAKMREVLSLLRDATPSKDTAASQADSRGPAADPERDSPASVIRPPSVRARPTVRTPSIRSGVPQRRRLNSRGRDGGYGAVPRRAALDGIPTSPGPRSKPFRTLGPGGMLRRSPGGFRTGRAQESPSRRLRPTTRKAPRPPECADSSCRVHQTHRVHPDH